MAERDFQEEQEGLPLTPKVVAFSDWLNGANGNGGNGHNRERIGDFVPDLDEQLAIEMKTGDVLVSCALSQLPFQVAVGPNKIEGVFGGDSENGEEIFRMSPVAVLKVVDSYAGRKVVNDVIDAAKTIVRQSSGLNGSTEKILGRLEELSQQEVQRALLDTMPASFVPQ